MLLFSQWLTRQIGIGIGTPRNPGGGFMWFVLLKGYLVYWFASVQMVREKDGIIRSSSWAASRHKSEICTRVNKNSTTDACGGRTPTTLNSERRCECCKTNQWTCASCFRAMLSEPAFLHLIKLAASMLLSEAMSIFDWSPASAFYFLQGATLLVLFHPGPGSNPLPQYVRVHHTFFLTIPIMMQKRFQDFGGGNFLQILLGPPESTEAYLGTSSCWSSLEGI